ncbi:MAG: NRDE family protein [Steroidobacteraceae bacterium]
MCLLVFAFGVHPHFDLVLAGNRDERHARPTAPLDWWSDAPGVLAGRDLEAGGTWLGVHRNGRFATVTNFREQQPRLPGGPSRGELVSRFLQGDESPQQYLDALALDADDYAGFNLLVADAHELWYGCNRTEDFARPLKPGIYGLGNDRLDAPWPKLVRSRERLTAWVDRGSADSQSLFAILADRVLAPWGPAEPNAELARAASAAFIVHNTYGTRASTVVTRERGRMAIAEQSFTAGGRPAGDMAFALELSGTEPVASTEIYKRTPTRMPD